MLLLSKNAGLMQEAGPIPLLAGLLEHLDRFNHLAPGKERDDNEDLAWPGIMGMNLAASGLLSLSSCIKMVAVHELLSRRKSYFTLRSFINQIIWQS